MIFCVISDVAKNKIKEVWGVVVMVVVVVVAVSPPLLGPKGKLSTKITSTLSSSNKAHVDQMLQATTTMRLTAAKKIVWCAARGRRRPSFNRQTSRIGGVGKERLVELFASCVEKTAKRFLWAYLKSRTKVHRDARVGVRRQTHDDVLSVLGHGQGILVGPQRVLLALVRGPRKVL